MSFLYLCFHLEVEVYTISLADSDNIIRTVCRCDAALLFGFSSLAIRGPLWNLERFVCQFNRPR